MSSLDVSALLHRADLWMHAQIPSENPTHLIGKLASALERLAAENAELREVNEKFGKRQDWWIEKMFQLETEWDKLRKHRGQIGGPR